VGGSDGVGAGLVLVVGGDAVLKVDVDHVRRTFRHFREQYIIRTGAKQLAAVWAGRGGGLQKKGHSAGLG